MKAYKLQHDCTHNALIRLLGNIRNLPKDLSHLLLGKMYNNLLYATPLAGSGIVSPTYSGMV